MRTFLICAALLAACLPGRAAAQRAWTEVPGLRAFVQSSGPAVDIPTDRGVKTVILGQKTTVSLPFEDVPGRYDRAEFEFREADWRNTFHVYALLDGEMPVRAVMADGEWVDRVPLELGKMVGVAVDMDYGERFDRYTVHATQHEGLLCITRGRAGRWLLRYDAKGLGPRFALATFVSTFMEFVMGETPAARSENFRREALPALGELLRLDSGNADERLLQWRQLYELGEYVHAEAPRPWRQDVIAGLKENLDKSASWWEKTNPAKGSALRQAVQEMAAPGPDRPLPIGRLGEAWARKLKQRAQSSHPAEVAFWKDFEKHAIAGVRQDHVSTFAQLILQEPGASNILSYLGKALVMTERPDDSPYLGPRSEARLVQLIQAMLPLDKAAPSRQEIATALQTFDVFVVQHTAKLDLDEAARTMLGTSTTAILAAQSLRALDPKSERFQRWSRPVARVLSGMANASAKKSLSSTAMGLFMHSWLLTHPEAAGLPPTGYTEIDRTGKVDALRALRGNAVGAAWEIFWLPLDPAHSETAALVDLLNRDPVLARTSFVSALGLTPGAAASFGPSLRDSMRGVSQRLLVMAGDPPMIYDSTDARAKQAAVWPQAPIPGLRDAQNSLAAARKALSDEVSLYENRRRFWGLDNARRRLAEHDGTPMPSAPARDSSNQRAYDEAFAKYQTDLRDGVYVGRSLERSDTVYTRSLSSGERMLREIELERLKRNMEDERREAQRRESEWIAQSQTRDRLTDEIFEIEQKVDTRGHLAKVAPLRRNVEYYEGRVEKLLAQQGSAGDRTTKSMETLSRAHYFRWTLRSATRNQMQQLAQKAKQSGLPEDEAELRWYTWLFAVPNTGNGPDKMMYFSREEDQLKYEDEIRLGKPLADFAGPLLAPLNGEPAAVEGGPDPALIPRLSPSAGWRANQVNGLLDDCWLRFQGEPYVLREKLFAVVKALRAVTGSDTISVESLRPWVKRFRAEASTELQRTALRWDKEPQLTALLDLAAK